MTSRTFELEISVLLFVSGFDGSDILCADLPWNTLEICRSLSVTYKTIQYFPFKVNVLLWIPDRDTKRDTKLQSWMNIRSNQGYHEARALCSSRSVFAGCKGKLINGGRTLLQFTTRLLDSPWTWIPICTTSADVKIHEWQVVTSAIGSQNIAQEF